MRSFRFLNKFFFDALQTYTLVFWKKKCTLHTFNYFFNNKYYIRTMRAILEEIFWITIA